MKSCSSGALLPVCSHRLMKSGVCVLTLQQATLLVNNMLGQYRLMAALMLNCGLHPRECINLRVRHLRWVRRQIIIPNTAGFAVRTSFLPSFLGEELLQQVDYIRRLHEEELALGFGQVRMPESFVGDVMRYSVDLGWQWLFSRHSLALEATGGSREKLILEVLNRRIQHAAELICLSEVMDVEVFWRSFLAGMP